MKVDRRSPWGLDEELVIAREIARKEPTRRPVANFRHDLWGTLDVDFHAGAFQPLDDNAHPPERRHKIEAANDPQFQEMSPLLCIRLLNGIPSGERDDIL